MGVFVYDWPDEPAPLAELRQKGAEIVKRPRALSLKRRLLLKAAGAAGMSRSLFLNPYRGLIQFQPDVIIITDGIYYTADDFFLKEVLKQFRKKYIILSQGNGPYSKPQNREETIRLFEDAKYMMFVAEHNRLLAFHQLAHELTNTFVIQNPVKLKTFEALPLPDVNDGVIHCAAVGRFCVSDKGQDMLVAMMAEEYWKKSNLVIHLYGKGEDRKYLEDLIRFYGVAGKVILEDHADIISIWEKCSCLLMPSLVEGTPLTLLEALVVGRICVVTRVGGNDEWVTDGVNGYIVEAPTQALFSEKLKQVIDGKAQWTEIAAEAHRSVMARLDKTPGHTLLGKALG